MDELKNASPHYMSSRGTGMVASSSSICCMLHGIVHKH